MNIADSSAWIEHFSDGPSASIFLPIIEDRKNLIVPTIVLYEVHKWISVFQSEDAAKRSAAIMIRDRIVQLDPVLRSMPHCSRSSINSQWPMPLSMQRHLQTPLKSGQPTTTSKVCQAYTTSKRVKLRP
jgi:hypothetical protein